MLKLIWKALAGVALLTLMPLGFAQGLHVSGPATGVNEFDLYDAKQGGLYVKTVDVSSLKFPIPIIEERPMGFVIRLKEGKFYVGASDVDTNKVYDTTAQCPSDLVGPTGASRGVRGKGCKKK